MARLRMTAFWRWALLFALAGFTPGTRAETAATNYLARGVVKEILIDEKILVIQHEKIPDYMDAMTMPFKVKEAETFNGLAPGNRIDFQLHVTENESWIDHVRKLRGTVSQPAEAQPSKVTERAEISGGLKEPGAAASGTHSKNPLRYFKFTNELGQAVSLADFEGQAIALTFFFTRCPVPEFCPRLSRNFQEVERKLSEMPNAPTNWHLISVTFDPRNDTAEALKAYGEAYHADFRHWSFVTGPPDKIAELAKLCDVKFDADGAFYNHNFRTLIIDAANRLQMVFPTSGDLSDSIVRELLKAAAATNRQSAQP